MMAMTKCEQWLIRAPDGNSPERVNRSRVVGLIGLNKMPREEKNVECPPTWYENVLTISSPCCDVFSCFCALSGSCSELQRCRSVLLLNFSRGCQLGLSLLINRLISAMRGQLEITSSMICLWSNSLIKQRQTNVRRQTKFQKIFFFLSFASSRTNKILSGNIAKKMSEGEEDFGPLLPPPQKKRKGNRSVFLLPNFVCFLLSFSFVSHC